MEQDPMLLAALSREKVLLEEIAKLREFVWLRDVPNPASPEYEEFHRKMQEILQFIDRILEMGGVEFG